LVVARGAEKRRKIRVVGKSEITTVAGGEEWQTSYVWI
jgi:hypothetical protein